MASISGYDSSSISTLFSSLSSSTGSSSSSDLLGISYSDYASLKNGSYHKLVSAYYTKVDSDGSSTSSSATKDTKQTLTSITGAAEDVKDSASTLLNKGKNALIQTKTDEKGNSYVDYDTDSVYKAVKDFVSDYNSLLDAASESETNSILRTAKDLVSYTSINKSTLSEIGITIGSDNKLSVDEDTFKNASKARVQSLMQSTGGYAYQVNAKATAINSYAASEAKKAGSSSQTSTSGTSSVTSTATSKDSTKTLGTIEDAAEKAQKSLSTLRTTDSKSLFVQVTTTDKDGKTETGYDKDAIYDAVNSFIKDYNTLVDATEDSSTTNILQARKTMVNYAAANKSLLANVGISISSDGSLTVDEDKFKNSDMSKVKSLFQDRNSFGAYAEQQISAINTYAENEAAKSNTYTDSGSYTYNYTAGDWYSSIV